MTKLIKTLCILIVSLFPFVILSSCQSPQQSKKLSLTTPTVSAASSSNVSEADKNIDYVAAPEAIILKIGGKSEVIQKGEQFSEILSLTSARLKGAKILVQEQWGDFEVAPIISGIDTIEFDYSAIQSSSFEYDGFHSSPLIKVGENPPKITMHSSITYTKLVFPLADAKDINGNDKNFSLSVFSYGDPSVIQMTENNRSCKAVFNISPIGSPNELLTYLKKQNYI